MVSQDITNQSEHRPAESSLYTPAIFFKTEQNALYQDKCLQMYCCHITLHV